MKKLIWLSLFFGLLCGCIPANEQVMSPVTYLQPIHVHCHKKAYLLWEMGKLYSSSRTPQIAANSGLIGAVIGTAIDQEMRQQHPGWYTIVYGKAQQAIFMTSLRDALLDNHVFKTIDVIVDPKVASADEVLMTIHFKSSRVSEEIQGFKIILDVELIIQTKDQPTFKRQYLVESDPGGFFNSKNFKTQQTDVSQQLLGKVIAGIHEWNKPIRR